MKKLLIIAILLISELISAQLQVKGTIYDQYGEPLAFASVILQDSEDSSQIFGTITTEEGVFVISDVPEGDYSLKVSLLGFTYYEVGILVNQNMVPQRIVLSES
ncbi:MAG: carboxypeptidase-like regulatory domain-containing protein, partial [Flavobacteriaceae bacterium]|nr:carboxypeptidase-like regulatory domain-containing protein [Flavobacteriaceae bacterium]